MWVSRTSASASGEETMTMGPSFLSWTLPWSSWERWMDSPTTILLRRHLHAALPGHVVRDRRSLLLAIAFLDERADLLRDPGSRSRRNPELAKGHEDFETAHVLGRKTVK